MKEGRITTTEKEMVSHSVLSLKRMAYKQIKDKL